MKRTAFLLVAVATVVGVVAYLGPVTGQADEEAASIFGITIPPGYRDWKLISVAHEAGNLNDIRAVLGNDVAIKAYREGKLPFPDGTIIARLAWNYVPSEENNKVFGRPQSFVAGAATNVQFMVKDSRNMPPQVAGGLLNSKTANLMSRRISKPVSLAMPLFKLVTTSSPSTHPHLRCLEDEKRGHACF